MKSEIHPFEYSVREVVACKMDLLADGGPFYYLRKGEAQGAVEVATYAINLLQMYQAHISGIMLNEASEILTKTGLYIGAASASVIALNKIWSMGLKQLESFFDNLEKTSSLINRVKGKVHKSNPPIANRRVSFPIPSDIRIICNRHSENEAAIPMLLALGARIRHRTNPEDEGTHRFHISNQRFAMYYKTLHNNYVGCIGNDNQMIEKLKADFLKEWEQCGKDVSI